MNRPRMFVQPLAVVIGLLVACTDGDVASRSGVASHLKVAPAPQTVITTHEVVVTTDDRGAVELSLPVAEGTTSMVLELINLTDDSYVAVDAVYSSTGDLVIDGLAINHKELSNAYFAVYPVASTLQLQLPVDDAAAPIEPGGWFVKANLYDDEADELWRSGVEIAARLTMKQQPVKARPSLKVHVVYVDGIEDDEAFIAGVEAAVALWRESAPTLHGFDMVVRTSTAKVPLGDGAFGNPGLEQMSSTSEPGELTVLLGEGVLRGGTLVGQAGGIPGPLAPSDSSGVVINVRSFGGVDGLLDDDEVKSLAGTMAHEAGHYLGLHHPVQSDFVTLDALADTDACEGVTGCTQHLLSNVMWPITVDGDVEQRFSDGQLLVMQRSVMVR